jgi:hypothetical protein
MKKLIAILALAVSLAGAINLDFPEELRLQMDAAYFGFWDAYENACQDSVEIFGIWIETPAFVTDSLIAITATARAQVTSTWQAVMAYILNGG